MNEIRIKGSMIKVYRCNTHTTNHFNIGRQVKLMQIPRLYRETYTIGGQTRAAKCSGFCSLVRFDGRWHLDSPYFCYSGNHKLRRLNARLSRKIDAIAICGIIYNGIHKTKNHLRLSLHQWSRRLSPIEAYRQWRMRKELKKTWGDLLA